MTIDLKTIEQKKTIAMVVFIFQFYPACNCGTFVNLALGIRRSERVGKICVYIVRALNIAHKDSWLLHCQSNRVFKNGKGQHGTCENIYQLKKTNRNDETLNRIKRVSTVYFMEQR